MWDPLTDTNVIGCKIHYGVVSHNYSNTVDVGNVNSVTIGGLQENTTYYFAATTYDSLGNESDYSNEAVFTYTPPVLLPPTLDVLNNLTVNENASQQLVPLSGISTGSGQFASITASSSNPSLIPNPTVNYSSPNSTGNLILTPAHNAFGSAIITVTVSNGQAQSNTVSRAFSVVVSAVNQPPTLNTISDIALPATAPAQTVTLSGISSGAANENQILQVTAVSSNPQLVPNPTVNYTSPNTSGTLSIKPSTNLTGMATITVTVNDGGTSNNLVSQVFSVNVSAVYQPPTLDALSNVVINENCGQQSVALSGVSPGIGQFVSITASSSNPNLIPAPVVNYVSPSSTGYLAFTPLTNTFGSAIITVTANNGQLQSNLITRSFTVSVNQVFLPPMFNPIGSVTFNENSGQHSIPLSGISLGSGQFVSFTASSSNPNLIPNPTVDYSSPSSTGNLILTPTADTWGSAVVTVVADNGQAQNNKATNFFSIEVTPQLTGPTLDPIPDLILPYRSSPQVINLTGISGGSNQAKPIVITAVSSDSKILGNPKIGFVQQTNTGTLTLVPVANTNGTVVVTVTLNNGAGSNNIIARSFSVTVAPNQAPTLDPIPDLALPYNSARTTLNLSGLSAGAPGESQSLRVTATSSDTHIIGTPGVAYNSKTQAGLLTIYPAANTNGSAIITVTVSDGSQNNNTISRSFSVTIAPNQAPVLDPIPDLTLPYGSGRVFLNLSGLSAGAPGEVQSLRITATSSDTHIVGNPSASFNNRTKSGGVNISPVANTNGTVTITVTVNDGGRDNNLTTRSFNVTVLPNQAPTLDPIANVTLPVNSGPQAVSLAGITSGSANEKQGLVLTAVSSNPKLLPNPSVNYRSPNVNGTLTLKPAANTNGTALITVTVNDRQKQNNLVSRTFLVVVGGPAPAQNPASQVAPPAKASLVSAATVNGCFSFHVNGNANQNYAVQASTDMANWTTLQVGTGAFDFADTNSAQFSQRFYRTVEVQ